VSGDARIIAYVGPALAGRSSNLQYVFHRTEPSRRSEMQSSADGRQRRIWFELRSATLAHDFVLKAAPGAIYTPEITEELIATADGLIFVADSQRARHEANLASLEEVRRFARPGAPLVLQWNKRDLPEIFAVPELEEVLNPDGGPSFEAIASHGTGVFATLRRCADLVLAARQSGR